MEKKDINKIPDGKKVGLNYKNIGIVIIILVVVILVSLISSNKSKKELKNKQNIVQANKIEESEIVSGTEVEKIIESNPVLKEVNKNLDNSDNENKMKEIMLEHEFQLKKMALALENERIERLRLRERTPLKLIEEKEIKEIKVKEKNGYEGLVIPPIPPFPEEDFNLQKAKEKFFLNSSEDDFILKKQLVPAISKYEVKAGTIIPLTLETAINTDLQGDITAVVKRDIYDSKTGQILLIPSGSRVLGKYSSNVSFGQERVQAVFNRITLPNQKSINIGSMKVVDKLGASGVTDKIDNKIGKVFGSVVMSAILGVGAGAVKDESEEGENWRNNAIDGGGTQAINVGNSYANKLLNVQPSLKIRQGYSIGIFINKDLILEPYDN